MAKSILKEVLIILLACVAIVLIMAVIFYNYIPTNKVVPAKVTAYQTPENVEAEIVEDTIESYNTSSEKNYTIENSDLTMYKATSSYDPGKPDPFAEYTEGTASNTDTNQENTSGTVDENTTDNYYTSQNIISGGK